MLYRSLDCPSRDHNKCEAMNGSVSLAVSISREKLCAPVSFVGYACVGCVQVYVTQKGDYFMFHNSHYLKKKSGNGFKIEIASSFNINKVTEDICCTGF